MNAAEMRYQEALAALNARRFADAETQFRRFLKDHPSHVGALNLLTIALMSMQRFAEAEPVIARAVKLNQSSDVSFYNYGLILKYLGKPKEAVAQFTQALRLNETVPDSWNNRGAALNEIGRHKDALANFDKAIALDRNYAAAHANKGRAFGSLHRYDEALAAYDEALALNPRLAEAWVGRGTVLNLVDRCDDALAALQQALAIDPNLAKAYSGIGNTLRDMGRLEEAREAYRKAIALEPASGEFFNLYAGIAKVSADDPHLPAMEALSADKAALPVDRMCADFALGKAHADIGEHERAFAHWLSGNALKRQQIDYDAVATAAHFADIESVFTPALIEAKSGSGDPSALPIFVLGMPRSGTTLVEQILSSHPVVHGAGELNAFGNILGEVIGARGGQHSYPQCAIDLDGATLREIGTRYVATLAKLAPEAAHVTDKLPGNFLYLGMICLALPNAKIVHTVRNPVDTCLSCFTHLFSEALDFSYDLAELGRFYAHYRHLMAHWHQVLPPGTILDVCYEDVVTDLEGQARRLLDHCGVPFDPRCLAFNESARPVRTASAAQVRQPIYKHSVERWRNYERWLGPLLRELDRANETA